MPDDKIGVIEAANSTVLLAFDLAKVELPLLPHQIKEALLSADVQDSITKTLQQFAETKIKLGTTVVSAEESANLFESLKTGAKDAFTESLEKQIKQTPQYKKLEESLTAFQNSVKSSEFGIFIDKNKKILYVVGAALVVGGAATLYITQTGGSVVKTPTELLKGKKFDILTIGTFKTSAKLLEFQPDARVFGLGIGVTKDWERVNLKLDLGVVAEGAKIQSIKGEAILKSGPVSLTATADAAKYLQDVNLGLKFNYNQAFGKNSLDISLGAMYQNNQFKGDLGANYTFKQGTSLGLTGNLSQNPAGNIDYSAMFTLKIPIK